MQLRFLLVTGPNVEPAYVGFGPGLNVIYGGSNTGKSHILELIDYMLGHASPPDAILEEADYDLVQLGIINDDGSESTLIRALRGGEIRVVDGLKSSRHSQQDGIVVSSKHGARASLSKLLLAQLGANDARVRVDARGKTRDLSFRDLAHQVLITESKIQERTSPIFSGQYTTKTAETSVFKFLLSGVDDSALDIAKPDYSLLLRQAAQLELLDKHIRMLDREISESDQDHEELVRLDKMLDERLAESFEVQEKTETAYRDFTGRRRQLRRELEAIDDRVAEIATLLARFDLLSQHYRSDERRLAAIAETGIFFGLEGATTCPVCGAEGAYHRPDHACEGNFSEIIVAAQSETRDITERAAELATTVQELASERTKLSQRAAEITEDLETLNVEIAREVPSVQTVRSETSRVLQQKVGIRENLALIRRRESLISERAELGISPGYDSSTIVAQQQLDGGVLDLFSQTVEAELQSWSFPDAKRVFFEVQKMDISVAGKSRSANGKGVRALLHGAFSISLMKYCRSHGRAHPGFLVLDSLFITYRDPDDAEEAMLASTPLKDRAFAAFANLTDDLQLIVLDNVDVPQWLEKSSQCVHFTGQPFSGRPGLYPNPIPKPAI
jgi:hypothetical protein